MGTHQKHFWGFFLSNSFLIERMFVYDYATLDATLDATLKHYTKNNGVHDHCIDHYTIFIKLNYSDQSDQNNNEFHTSS